MASTFKQTLDQLVNDNAQVIKYEGAKIEFYDVTNQVLREKYNAWIKIFNTKLSEFQAPTGNEAMKLSLYMQLAAYHHVLQKLLFKYINTSKAVVQGAAPDPRNVQDRLLQEIKVSDISQEQVIRDLQAKYKESQALKESLQIFFNDSMASLEALSELPAIASPPA